MSAWSDAQAESRNATPEERAEVRRRVTNQVGRFIGKAIVAGVIWFAGRHIGKQVVWMEDDWATIWRAGFFTGLILPAAIRYAWRKLWPEPDMVTLESANAHLHREVKVALDRLADRMGRRHRAELAQTVRFYEAREEQLRVEAEATIEAWRRQVQR